MRGSMAGPARRVYLPALVVTLVSLALAGGAAAVIPPDVPLTSRPPMGARAAGMAGATIALPDDGGSLLQNPGALAGVLRPSAGGAVDRRTLEQDVNYLGQRETSKNAKTKISQLGFAYPFPVYRGSFVIGMSYDRVIPLDGEYYRAGPGGQTETETILEDGGVGAWSAGLAFDASSSLSLGISGTILAGSSRRERNFDYRQGGGPDWELTRSTTEMDLNAVTGTVGALLRPSPWIRAGVVLRFPENYTLKGQITEDVQRYQVTGDTLDYRDTYAFEDKVKLPLRVSAGLAVAAGGALRGLTITGQADLADWTQIDYAGPIRTSNREYAYRSVTDLRFGLEYARDLELAAGSRLPLRLRAGYASLPVPYRLIATDVFLGSYRAATFDSDRSTVSAGLGFGLDPNTMLDLAWNRTSFERSGAADNGRVTREVVRESSVVAGITFRMQ
jgi:hypothetical protein